MSVLQDLSSHFSKLELTDYLCIAMYPPSQFSLEFFNQKMKDISTKPLPNLRLGEHCGREGEKTVESEDQGVDYVIMSLNKVSQKLHP